MSDHEEHSDPDELLQRIQVEAEQWERQWGRKQARRRRMARWFLIPHAACSVATGVGIGMVLDAGMRLTSALLVVGVAGILAYQWVQPELMWHRRQATGQQQQRAEGEKKPE